MGFLEAGENENHMIALSSFLSGVVASWLSYTKVIYQSD